MGLDAVLLHDEFGDRHVWDAAVARGLGDRRRVVAIDFDRDAGSGGRGFEAWTEEALAAIDRCAGGRAALVGTGTGGIVATAAAARRPDLVESVVSVAPRLGAVETALLAPVECPVAIVHGERGRAISSLAIESLEAILGRAVAVTVVTGAADDLLRTRPAATAGAIAGALTAAAWAGPVGSPA